MMEDRKAHRIIDRYAKRVASYLPRSMRGDVRREIVASLEEDVFADRSAGDMRDPYDALDAWGSPFKVASKYTSCGRFFIHERYLGMYRDASIVLMSILLVVYMAVTLLGTGIFVGEFHMDFFIKMMFTLVGVEATLFMTLTLGFAIASHAGKKRIESTSRSWSWWYE